MVRTMLTVVALVGVAAEQNVTTTTPSVDAPGQPPIVVNDGCIPKMRKIPDGSKPFKQNPNTGKWEPQYHHFPANAVGSVGQCHLVCDLVGFPGHHEALDFTRGGTMKANIIAELVGETKKRCYGCPSLRALEDAGEGVCRKNGGTPCYTSAQMDAAATEDVTNPGHSAHPTATKHYHGCHYGSDANTCAYEGSFKDEVLVDEVMPEKSCRYSWIGNTGIPGLDAMDKLIEGSPIEV